MSHDALSPLDGRYASEVRELARTFSERGLMRYRLQVEVEYLIALTRERRLSGMPWISAAASAKLRKLYTGFGAQQAARVAALERTCDHDVKALEYFVAEELRKLKLGKLIPFYHFALTSEDVNNIAYTLMLHSGVLVYVGHLSAIIRELSVLARRYGAVPLLAMTHGQPATPTTVGKELAVYVARLRQQLAVLSAITYTAKFSGATGNWSAQQVAYPRVDWVAFSRRFVGLFGLQLNQLTTQIEPHDTTAQVCHALMRLNSIVKDLDVDLWLYISRGVFKLKRKPGEVGSSTMPQKVNPLKFEKSEGNLGLANSLLGHLAEKLPTSRLQRDLSDSTVIRNQGVALGYAVVALRSTRAGIARLEVDRNACRAELAAHWEVLTEAVQTMLRKHGVADAYEQLKAMSRGQPVTKATLQQFIRTLKLPAADKRVLLRLTPATYVGLAPKLARLASNP